MSVDEVTKLIFILSISLGILGISFQLARILGKTADIIGDLRRSVQNIGNLSDKFVDDYAYVSDAIKGVAGFVIHFNKNILDPLKNVIGIFSRFRRDEEDDTAFYEKE